MEKVNTPGENLRLMRELAGFSQKSLAAAVGLNWPQQISHLETGKRNIGPNMVKKLARAFNLPVEEFKRVLQSPGDPDKVKLWLKIHEIKDKDECSQILEAMEHLIDVYQVSKRNPTRHRETFDQLMRQIRILARLSKENHHLP